MGSTDTKISHVLLHPKNPFPLLFLCCPHTPGHFHIQFSCSIGAVPTLVLPSQPCLCSALLTGTFGSARSCFTHTELICKARTPPPGYSAEPKESWISIITRLFPNKQPCRRWWGQSSSQEHSRTSWEIRRGAGRKFPDAARKSSSHKGSLYFQFFTFIYLFLLPP